MKPPLPPPPISMVPETHAGSDAMVAAARAALELEASCVTYDKALSALNPFTTRAHGELCLRVSDWLRFLDELREIAELKRDIRNDESTHEAALNPRPLLPSYMNDF